MKRISWTDERIKTLKDGWAAGLSATILGAAMGVSRCSILGKVRRLDLPKRRDMDAERANPPRRSRSIAAIAYRKAASLNKQPANSFGFIKQAKPEELTKGQLRAMLAEACRNTAVM